MGGMILQQLGIDSLLELSKEQFPGKRPRSNAVWDVESDAAPAVKAWSAALNPSASLLPRRPLSAVATTTSSRLQQRCGWAKRRGLPLTCHNLMEGVAATHSFPSEVPRAPQEALRPSSAPALRSPAPPEPPSRRRCGLTRAQQIASDAWALEPEEDEDVEEPTEAVAVRPTRTSSVRAILSEKTRGRPPYFRDDRAFCQAGFGIGGRLLDPPARSPGPCLYSRTHHGSVSLWGKTPMEAHSPGDERLLYAAASSMPTRQPCAKYVSAKSYSIH